MKTLAIKRPDERSVQIAAKGMPRKTRDLRPCLNVIALPPSSVALLSHKSSPNLDVQTESDDRDFVNALLQFPRGHDGVAADSHLCERSIKIAAHLCPAGFL